MQFFWGNRRNLRLTVRNRIDCQDNKTTVASVCVTNALLTLICHREHFKLENQWRSLASPTLRTDYKLCSESNDSIFIMYPFIVLFVHTCKKLAGQFVLYSLSCCLADRLTSHQFFPSQFNFFSKSYATLLEQKRIQGLLWSQIYFAKRLFIILFSSWFSVATPGFFPEGRPI